MQPALDYLCALLDQGAEFPDAAFTAAQKFGVDQADLEADYDRSQS